MNNWTVAEMAFRCDRLSVRMERLAQNFLRIESLMDGVDAEVVLEIIRESKMFIEFIAIDLDIDSAFELTQIQRQLSRWHLNWLEIWKHDPSRLEISNLAQIWAHQIREMAGVFV